MSHAPHPIHIHFSNCHSSDNALPMLKKRARPKSILKTTIAVVILILTIALVSGCSTTKNVVRPIINNTGADSVIVYIRNTGTVDWGTKQQQPRIKQDDGYSIIYAKDSFGNIIYDPIKLDNEETYKYSFEVPPRGSEEETTELKTVDVKLVDAQGFIYGKNNVDLSSVEKIVITRDDLYPILVMQNNTEFPITVTSPISAQIKIGSNTIYQVPELTNDNKCTVSYSMGQYRFDKEIMLRGRDTLKLSRPPMVTVQNNTGFPVTIKINSSVTAKNNTKSPTTITTSPSEEIVADGNHSRGYLKSNVNEIKQIISYMSGKYVFNKEVMVYDKDIIMTLTEKDRPPIVTVQNNTGNNVNLVFLRNPGLTWLIRDKDHRGMLSIPLHDATKAQINSFTNKESFRFWLGDFEGWVEPYKYYVRIDGVDGISYVKNDVEITEDVTITFSPEDKP